MTDYEGMTPEEIAEAEDQEAEYIANEIDAYEQAYEVELSDEAVDAVIDAARANRDEDGDPDVAEAFDGLMEAHAEAEAAAEANETVSAEELAAAIRGDYGPEVQARAAAAAGVELEDIEEELDEDNDPDGPWLNEYLAQEARLERKLGRGLTQNERAKLEADAVESDQAPDLLGRYDEVVGRSSKNQDDQHQVAVETFEEHQAEDAPPKAEPPAEPDLSNDDERRAAMVADMEAIDAAEAAV
jgi:hypothetical protein